MNSIALSTRDMASEICRKSGRRAEDLSLYCDHSDLRASETLWLHALASWKKLHFKWSSGCYHVKADRREVLFFDTPTLGCQDGR